MNERIVKLITEADAYAWTISEKYVLECGEVNYLWEDAFRKKFAELIVRECVATIANDTANYPGEGMMAYYQGVQDSARAIKKHFGVDGMSTEDKKTLIKELLGVKND